jgi:hypothetical protein
LVELYFEEAVSTTTAVIAVTIDNIASLLI